MCLIVISLAFVVRICQDSSVGTHTSGPGEVVFATRF